MTYAIMTHACLALVRFDERWRVLQDEVVDRGYHFGATVLESRSAEEAPRLLAYRGGPSVHEQDSPELRTWLLAPAGARLESVRPLPRQEWGDIHQIAHTNGGLYLANTGRNRVVYLGDDGGRDEYAFEGRDEDWNHVNSVYVRGDRIFAVLHNKGRRESELVLLRHQPGEGFEHERTLGLWDIGCHNLFIDERGLLFYHASQAGELVIVDLEEDRVVARIPFPGWHGKGMSVSGDTLVVGLSEHTIRDRRASARARLAVVDLPTLNLETIVELDLPSLDSPVGNVNEVRLVSAPERAETSGAPPDVDWDALEMIRGDRVRHAAFRVRLGMLLPLRRLNKRFRQMTS